MRISLLAALGVMCLLGATMARALDPTAVDGVVSVTVDQSKQPWSVTVTNRSDQEVTYEMMGKVPRGLGIELWEEGIGTQLHAEDLAEYLDTDGFPADLRELKPKGAVRFQLNPKSMSSTDQEQFEKWEQIERIGYYNCRVFFGVYASRIFSVEPTTKNKRGYDDSATALKSEPVTADEKGEEEPAAVIKQWADSFNHNDAEKHLRHYFQSDETEVLVSTGLWYHGYKEVADGFRDDLKLVQFSKSRIEDLRVARFGDMATVSFIHRFHYVILANGVECLIQIRTTSTLKKTDKGWRIVMEHSSPLKDVPRVTEIHREGEIRKSK